VPLGLDRAFEEVLEVVFDELEDYVLDKFVLVGARIKEILSEMALLPESAQRFSSL